MFAGSQGTLSWNLERGLILKKKKKKKGLFRLIYTRYSQIQSQFPPLKSYEGRVSFQISLVDCSRSHCLKNVESFKKKKRKEKNVESF